MEKTKKKYNLTVAPLWETQGDGYISIAIKPDMYDAMQQVKIGGKLLIKRAKSTAAKSDKSPHAYLEYITPEDVAEFEQFLQAKRASAGGDERL